jgi:hypothetical protein
MRLQLIKLIPYSNDMSSVSAEDKSEMYHPQIICQEKNYYCLTSSA